MIIKKSLRFYLKQTKTITCHNQTFDYIWHSCASRQTEAEKKTLKK